MSKPFVVEQDLVAGETLYLRAYSTWGLMLLRFRMKRVDQVRDSVKVDTAELTHIV